MHSFKTEDGRVIRFAITVATIKRVKADCGVDLGQLDGKTAAGQSILMALQGLDFELLVDVLHSVCAPCLTELGLSPLDFAELLSGEVLGTAMTALFEEWVLFFAGLGRSDQVQQIQEALRLMELATRKGTALAEAGAARLAAQIETWSPSVIELAGSSDSTPSPSVTES